MKSLRSLPVIAQFFILLGIILLSWTAATIATLALARAGLDITSQKGLLITQGISQVLVFLVPSLLFVLFFHRNDRFLRYDSGLRQWQQVGLGLLALLLLTPAVDALGQWNDSWHFGAPWASVETMLRNAAAHAEALTGQMLTMPHWSDLVWVLLIVALLPALCEELLFRGIIQNAIKRRWHSIHAAVWITALLFSLCHGDLFALLPRLLLGALLGYLFVYSGSLLVNSLVHFVNNAIVVVHYYLFQHGVLQFSPDDPLDLPLTLTLCCIVAAAYVMWEVYKKNPSDRSPKDEQKNTK